jgi:hypothetical protein
MRLNEMDVVYACLVAALVCLAIAAGLTWVEVRP